MDYWEEMLGPLLESGGAEAAAPVAADFVGNVPEVPGGLDAGGFDMGGFLDGLGAGNGASQYAQAAQVAQMLGANVPTTAPAAVPNSSAAPWSEILNGFAPGKAATKAPEGWLSKLAEMSGFNDPKKGLQNLQLLGLLGSLVTANSKRGRQTPAELRAQLARPADNWTPQQQQYANNYFNAAPRQFTYQAPPLPSAPAYATGGHLEGDAGGQDDVLPINAAPGEYVIDADAVSALGDGNNKAGAGKLQQMVENLRAHKRSAPTNSIPPKAKAPLQYLGRKGK